MMIDEVRGLLDQYAQWVRDKSILSVRSTTSTSRSLNHPGFVGELLV